MIDTYRLALLLAFQAPAICFVLCLYIFLSLPRNGINQRQYILIRLMTIGCVGGVTSEVVNGLMLYDVLDWSIDYYPINSTVAYAFVLLYAISLSEFCISYLEINSKPLRNILRVLYGIVGISLISRILFIGSKLFTYVDKDGNVAYGALDDMVLWGCLSIYIFMTCFILKRFLDGSDYVNHEKNGRLLFAVATMTLALLLYSLFYLPYVIMLGSMLVVMIIFSSLQSLVINHDELTSLNNRRRMLKDIEEYHKSRRAWSYILMDINDFKQINDSFGHNEGDNALTIVAAVLNEIALKNNSEAYRIGGDEFVVVVPSSDKTLLSDIISEIESDLNIQAVNNNIPYSLTLSFGYSSSTDCNDFDIQKIIETADAKMYEDKNRRKISLNQVK